MQQSRCISFHSKNINYYRCQRCSRIIGERCSRTIAAPDGDLRPLLPRRCTPRVCCRNAVQRRTSTVVLTEQTKSSMPDCGTQLKS